MRRPSYFSPGIILFVWVMTGCGPNRIVYQHADTLGGQKDVWVIREDGMHGAVLANSQDDEQACGVTTDRRVVFTRQTPDGGDLYVVNEDGTGLTPLMTTPDDDACFGVTGHDMVIFGRTVSVTNHDLYSVSATSSLNSTPMTLSATPLDELPMAIGWDNRIVYAKQDVTTPIDGHRYSFDSINDDGSQDSHVVGVFEEPKFVAISPGHRMIWSRPGQPPNGGLFGTTTSPPISTAAFNQFLHILGWTEDRFCGFTFNGRVLLTSLGVYPVDGQPTGFGHIYLLNDDGTNLIRINPGPRDFNEVCVGATDDWVIAARYPDLANIGREGPTALWSYPTSGAGNPVQLVKSTSSNQFALTYEGITPGGRVLFRTFDQTTNMERHASIAPDGSGLVMLTTAHGGIAGFTIGDQVVYSIQGAQFDLDTIPSHGQTALRPLAAQPVVNVLSFSYFTDAMNRASRCRVCWWFPDRGGVPVPSPLPPP